MIATVPVTAHAEASVEVPGPCHTVEVEAAAPDPPVVATVPETFTYQG
jgi:hypothetical protein